MPYDALKKVIYIKNLSLQKWKCNYPRMLLITVLKSKIFKLNYLKLYFLALINLQYFITSLSK